MLSVIVTILICGIALAVVVTFYVQDLLSSGNEGFQKIGNSTKSHAVIENFKQFSKNGSS